MWIKERESTHNLHVVRMGAPSTVTAMERAMEAGHSVLIENMGENIDAVLNPVITRSTFKKVLAVKACKTSRQPACMQHSLSERIICSACLIAASAHVGSNCCVNDQTLQHSASAVDNILQGRSLYVKLGDKDVEYNKNFKLILHTKLSNPHYPPEIQAETTLINFTVTESGLEDQLLALVVNKERPDLEETKTQLIIQNTDFTIKLKQVSCIVCMC